MPDACAKDVYLINEGPADLPRCTVAWELREPAGGKPVAHGGRALSLPQGAIQKETAQFTLPATPGILLFAVALNDEQGKRLAGDEMTLDLYPPPMPPHLGAARVVLFDPAAPRGPTAVALNRMGARHEPLSDLAGLKALAPTDLLILGAGAVTREVADAEPLLKAHLARGGRMLVLEQPMADRTARSFAFVKAPAHPAFRGLHSPYLSVWRTPSHNLCLGSLRVAATARSTVLADLADAPALVESRFGSGTLVMSNLELVAGCLQGEPEAQIIPANLLSCLATRPAPPTVGVRYIGGEATRTFLKEAMRLDGVQPWRSDERLSAGDVAVIGADAPAPAPADKQALDRFVSEGATALVLGDPRPAAVAWLPEPVEIAKVSAAYLLKKHTVDRLLDGLGPLYTLRSERAMHYFTADPIPDLTHGCRLPANGTWQPWYAICDGATHEYRGLWRRSHYSESQAQAVAYLAHGRGRYVVAALPMKANPVTQELLAALFANLGAPSTDDRCFLAFAGLAAAPTARRAGPRDWQGFVKVDLVAWCNRLFNDDVAEDGVGGWDDSGDNDLRSMPTGDLLLGGIPFRVIDVQHDDPNEDIRNRLGHPIRSCIVLKGTARPKFPERVDGIPVSAKLRKLFFLHTATWCGGPEGRLLARYVVHYADGATAKPPLRKGIELDDWTRVSRGDLKESTVAWAGSNAEHPHVGLYLTAWANPHPDKEIAAIDFASEGTAIPILVANTGQR